MKRYLLTGLGALAVGVLLLSGGDRSVWAHCQVPCGIYDDSARISALLEDTTTIAKAMSEMHKLAENKDPLSVNQMTRWVITKEEHATRIIDTVAAYFLTQLVKEVEPGAEGYTAYLESLATHHRVMRLAMKCKQTVDPANAEALKAAIEKLGQLYHHGHQH
ncbi:MAG: hypothetical protein GXY44_02600 [Phycisphaerales bacterium]|nr:hypothetical protein [Phycisphaerales bacterium]